MYAEIPKDREHRMHAWHRFRDEVVMLGRLQRHVDSGQATNRPSPHAGAIDHNFSPDLTRRRPHTGGTALMREDSGNPRVFKKSSAAESGALGERLGHVRRIDARVIREIERRLEVADIGQRPHALDLVGGDFVRFDAETFCHVNAAAHLFGLVRGHRQLNGTAADEPRRLSGLRFELAIEVLGIFGEPCLRFGVAQGSQEARRMPGRTRRELRLLEHNDVAASELGEVIRDRTADDPAADDDHARLFRQSVLAHVIPANLRETHQDPRE